MAYQRICPKCGKEFYTYQKERRFCSVSCATLSRAALKYSALLAGCLECLKKCQSQREFKCKFPKEQRFAAYHHLPEYYALPLGKPRRKIYTNEEVEVAARKYSTKAEFHKNDLALYFCALRRGLMPQFTWLRSEHHLYDEINYIYRYYFPSHNAVYVGRTIKPDMRDHEHRRDRGRESSIVFKFAKEHSLEIPEMELLETGLSGEESQIKEDEYISLYREQGCLILNTGATGLGTSSMGGKKKNTRKKVLEVARQYEWLRDFAHAHPNLYGAACAHGWIHDLDFLKRKQRPHSLFTKEFCLSVARQYSSRLELSKSDYAVYHTMLHNKWLDECPWLPSSHDGRITLTHDYCISVARCCKSLTQLCKIRPPVAKKLYKTGWIKECTWFPKYAIMDDAIEAGLF